MAKPILPAIIPPKTALLMELLRHDDYGLSLIDRLAKRSKGSVKLNMGSVYPALRSLEKEGLLSSYQGGPNPVGGRRRLYYRVTPVGRRLAKQYMAALKRWVQD